MNRSSETRRVRIVVLPIRADAIKGEVTVDLRPGDTIVSVNHEGGWAWIYIMREEAQ